MFRKIKHIRYFKPLSFIFLLGVMFVLNKHIEKEKVNISENTESIQIINSNNSGLAPLSAQLPNKTEGALPLRLISNPNSIFLVFVNKGYEHINAFKLLDIKKRYLHYCARFNANYLTSFVISLKNKDIQ